MNEIKHLYHTKPLSRYFSTENLIILNSVNAVSMNEIKHLHDTKLYFDMLVRASIGTYLEVLLSLYVSEYPVPEVEVDRWACDPV